MSSGCNHTPRIRLDGSPSGLTLRRDAASSQQLDELNRELAHAQELAAHAEADRPDQELAAQQEAIEIIAHATVTADAVRGAAKAAFDELVAACDRRQQLLDRARQHKLLRERLERLPSLAFATSRVAQLRSDASEAQTVAAERWREHGQARALLTDTENATGLARRMRRLPRPEQQKEAVEAALRALADARARVSACDRAVTEAEEQCAEIERLAREIGRDNSVPSVASLEDALAADERAIAEAGVAVNKAESEGTAIEAEAREKAESHFREAMRTIDEVQELWANRSETIRAAITNCEASIAEFLHQHGAPPRETLDRAVTGLAEVDELRRQRDLLASQMTTAESDLRRTLNEEAGHVTRFGESTPTATDLRVTLDRLRDVVPRLISEAASVDISEVREQETDARNRFSAIAKEIAAIEEQLQRVESEVILRAMVIATTLTKAYLSDDVQSRRFDTVILDEASMAPIPALWAVASVAERNVVIVGDPHQLPPISVAADNDNQETAAYRWLAQDIFKVSASTRRRQPI